MPNIIAVSNDIEVIQTKFISLKQSSATQNKLVALWQLNEHSKLYCQWVIQTNNTNK